MFATPFSRYTPYPPPHRTVTEVTPFHHYVRIHSRHFVRVTIVPPTRGLTPAAGGQTYPTLGPRAARRQASEAAA
eukprot:130704-Pyramimonas_sp.AAC.1